MSFRSRRQFLRKIFLAGCAFGPLPSFPSCSISTNRNPNIILIMADDLGYGDLGCYGSQIIQTPNLDKLATGGVKFTDFHSNGAVCSPTRAALLTGKYQQRCGIDGVITAKNHRDKGMPLQEITFAEVFKSFGYTTALFGKWHLGYPVRFNPVKQGFDEFRGYVSGNVDYFSHIDQEGYQDWWHNDRLKDENGYTTHLITRHALEFLDRNRGRPFCLYLPHEAPHGPFQGPDDTAIRKVGNPLRRAGNRREKAAAYKAMVEVLDESVGQVVKKLHELNIEKNTFLFFCSDNGPARFGSAGELRGRKASVWEGGHRVPAIAYWPGRLPAGKICHETVMTMDLFPTMVFVVGKQLPANLKLDGVDISPALFKDEKLPERPLFWKFKNKSAIRKGDWKLVGDELFNLARDLGEKQNVADQYPKIVKELKSLLKTWESEVSKGVQPVS